MERDEPPPMTSEVTLEAKKDIFDDDEDDELFKSAIDNKLESKSEKQGQEEEEEQPTSTSGYETSEVKHSNTLDDLENHDLDNQDVFKSVVEPSSDKFNGNEVEEKDIPLDDTDEDEPQYEEEKLKVIFFKTILVQKLSITKNVALSSPIF